MSAVDKMIEWAKSWVGYLEKKDGNTKYLWDKTANAGNSNYTCFAYELAKTTILNGSKQGFPWCSGFILDGFYQNFGQEKTLKALSLPEKSLAAGCYYFVNYLKSAGKYGSTPKIGSLIFFKDSDGEPCHIGIVYGWDSNTVWTIEGNTSGASGVIANGGGVCRKSYSRNYNMIHGYGYPDYSVLETEEFTEGWVQNENGWWYRNKDGSWPVSELKLINNKWYYFDKNGYVVVESEWDYNGYHYVADSNGILTITQSQEEQEEVVNNMNKVFGIDISAWQGDFDIAKAVSSAGIKFVILKAGGADDGYYKDSKFESFYSKAKSANINVGAYFFSKALNTDMAKKEAQYFYENCLKGKQFDLPVYLDVENKTQLAIGKTTLTSVIKTWCETIKSYGFLPGIYSSLSYFSNYMNDSELKSYEHWVAQWSTSCQYSGCGMWQFGGETNYIRSNKINGQTIDQDYMLKDYPTYIKTNGLNGYPKKTYTEGWKKTNNKWWYQYSDGTYPINKWAKIDNKWYHFDEGGYLETNKWIYTNNKYYYVGANGEMAVNKMLKIDANGEVVPYCNFYYQLKDVTYDVYKNTLNKMIKKGYLKGESGSGENMVINLSEEVVRAFVIQDRAGLFDK